MSSFKSGDLAYLPSQVKLVQSDNTGTPRAVHKTSKPQNVLIVGDGHCPHELTILLDGEKWSVQASNLYTISNEATYD